MVEELNGVIASRNLYRYGRYGVRYINATLTKHGAIEVENLYSSNMIEFVNDGSFVDGYGRSVIL